MGIDRNSFLQDWPSSLKKPSFTELSRTPCLTFAVHQADIKKALGRGHRRVAAAHSDLFFLFSAREVSWVPVLLLLPVASILLPPPSSDVYVCLFQWVGPWRFWLLWLDSLQLCWASHAIRLWLGRFLEFFHCSSSGLCRGALGRLLPQALLRLSLAGAMFRGDAAAHWNTHGCNQCKWCGRPDSLTHRYWECCQWLMFWKTSWRQPSLGCTSNFLKFWHCAASLGHRLGDVFSDGSCCCGWPLSATMGISNKWCPCSWSPARAGAADRWPFRLGSDSGHQARSRRVLRWTTLGLRWLLRVGKPGLNGRWDLFYGTREICPPSVFLQVCWKSSGVVVGIWKLTGFFAIPWGGWCLQYVEQWLGKTLKNIAPGRNVNWKIYPWLGLVPAWHLQDGNHLYRMSTFCERITQNESLPTPSRHARWKVVFLQPVFGPCYLHRLLAPKLRALRNKCQKIARHQLQHKIIRWVHRMCKALISWE